MVSPVVTSWTVIQEASAGLESARAEFARRYESIVRAYLAHRWRGGPFVDDLEDAVQEVFVECFKAGGVLESADADRPGGFRAFLYGVIRNIAFRFEKRRYRRREVQASEAIGRVEDREESLSRVFDQAWARMVLKEAASLQAAGAEGEGGEPARRVELLRLRFEEGLPIRDIASRWQEDPARVHRQYRLARSEFRDALREVLARHHGGAEAQLEEDRLLGLF